MDLSRMDMDRMRLVRDRRALVNTAIKPGFHKGRIFHTQLGQLTSQCYVIGSTVSYEDRQLSLARGIWHRLSNTVVSESCDS